MPSLARLLRRSAQIRLSLYLMASTLGVNANGIANAQDADWPVYLGGKERNLYSPLQQIHRDNVSQLEVAWTYDTGDKAEYQANNLIVDGVLYTPTQTR